MATLTIKKFPQELYDKLRERAERNRRSINSEAIACFEQLLSASPADAESVISEAEAIHRRIGRTLPDLVAEGKKEGRA